MKKLILILFASTLLLGCTSTTSIDTQKCVKESSIPQKNRAKSGDDLFKECLDRQHQANESKKGFWEKSAEGLAFFILDIIAS